MNMTVRQLVFSLIASLLMSLTPIAQSGGGFEIQRSVIAGGGGESSGDIFVVSSTIGQSLAGSKSSGSGFAVNSGFWTALAMTPTAADVSISGRVLTATGGGIRNVHLTLTSVDGTIHHALTNAFGTYSFDQVIVGHPYVLEITAKHFVFAESIRVLDVRDELVGINFVAQ